MTERAYLIESTCSMLVNASDRHLDLIWHYARGLTGGAPIMSTEDPSAVLAVAANAIEKHQSERQLFWQHVFETVYIAGWNAAKQEG